MYKNIIAIDIETTGLHPYEDKITCIGIWHPDFSRVYRDLTKFNKDLNTLYKDYKIVGHNFSFDFWFLKNNNINIEYKQWEHDTQNMAHVCNKKVSKDYIEWYNEQRKEANKLLPKGYSHREGKRHSLKVLAPYFLNVEPFWENPVEHNNNEYVLKDCEYTYRLFEKFASELMTTDEKKFYYNSQMPWSKMLLHAGMTGITLDLEELHKKENEYIPKQQQKLRELDDVWQSAHTAWFNKKQIEVSNRYKIMCTAAIDKLKEQTPDKINKTKERYGKLEALAVSKLEHKINYDSSTQMTWLLKDYKGYDINTYKGDESTGKSVLQRLSEQHEDVALFLEYRKINKIITSYFPSYKKLNINGILHTSFKATGTRTGRLSSGGLPGVNLQQVPSDLYNLFKPREGQIFIGHDMAGIEAKLIAFYSGDPNLTKIVQQGHSIHDYNVAHIFFPELNVRPEDVKENYPKERKVTKELGFSLFYGAGHNRIKEVFQKHGYPRSKQQAKDIYKRFTQYYSKARGFHEAVTNIFARGEVINNLVGRPIMIQNANEAYMKGFNTLIQSSASDLNLLSAYKTLKLWHKNKIKGDILIFVHDFILAEVEIDQAEEADKILKKAMIDYTLTNECGKIDLEVDGGIMQRWEK